MAPPALGVLDLATVGSGSSPRQALLETTELAKAAERLGYQRMWVAEHHAMPAVASAAPAVLVAHLAAATSTMRVGSGGVMLPNHSPLVVAEQFATLEALHPGRIDLGLGRAPGTDPATARALRRRIDLSADDFPDDVVELLGYLSDHDGAPTHPAPIPGRGYLPQVWLLGSSVFSAQLAGVLGLPFCFAYHFSPGPVDEALDAYRSKFRPSAILQAPHAMVAVSVLCAPSEEEARWLGGAVALGIWQLRTGRLGPFPSPEEAAAHPLPAVAQELVDDVMATHVIGDPAAVRAGLAALVARTGADELMISTRIHGQLDRLRSLALVAGAMGLDAPGQRAAEDLPVADGLPATDGLPARSTHAGAWMAR